MKKNTSAKPLPSSGEYPDYVLQAAAVRTVRAFINAYNKKHRFTIPMPQVTFDLHLHKPKCAGVACGFHEVQINMVLFRDHPEEILNKTIPHECAHTAESFERHRLNAPDEDHGARWVKFMNSMAQPPLRYHGMNVSKSVAAYKAAKKAKKKPKDES